MTNDSATLDHHESYYGSNSIIIDNAQSLPITYIGHSSVSTDHRNHLFLKFFSHAFDLS